MSRPLWEVAVSFTTPLPLPQKTGEAAWATGTRFETLGHLVLGSRRYRWTFELYQLGDVGHLAATADQRLAHLLREHAHGLINYTVIELHATRTTTS